VKSGRYLPRRFAGRQISTLFHFNPLSSERVYHPEILTISGQRRPGKNISPLSSTSLTFPRIRALNRERLDRVSILEGARTRNSSYEPVETKILWKNRTLLLAWSQRLSSCFCSHWSESLIRPRSRVSHFDSCTLVSVQSRVCLPLTKVIALREVENESPVTSGGCASPNYCSSAYIINAFRQGRWLLCAFRFRR